MSVLRALLLAALLGAGPAAAHKPSDSYLSLEMQASPVRAQWDIALRDLEHAIGLDADGDGVITWGELRAKQRDIETYALARLVLSSGGKPCPLLPTGFLVDEHSDGAYAVLRLEARCEATSGSELEVEYSLFFDLDPTHRGLLRADLGAAGTKTGILSPERPRVEIGTERPPATQLVEYLREGVWHIWIGFDHILFLLSLLLPCVFTPARKAWIPVERFAEAFWDVFRVVTAFTVAHSITLGLAALGLVQLPSRLVESAIAFSVVLAALNNVWPLVHGRRWMVAFGFGLLHGFGFASVLADLGLPQGALLAALLGFNLGVEAGQLAIVAVFLPLAYAARRSSAYRRLVLVAGSLLIALVAALWFVERAFDLQLGLI